MGHYFHCQSDYVLHGDIDANGFTFRSHRNQFHVLQSVSVPSYCNLRIRDRLLIGVLARHSCGDIFGSVAIVSRGLRF